MNPVIAGTPAVCHCGNSFKTSEYNNIYCALCVESINGDHAASEEMDKNPEKYNTSPEEETAFESLRRQLWQSATEKEEPKTMKNTRSYASYSGAIYTVTATTPKQAAEEINKIHKSGIVTAKGNRLYETFTNSNLTLPLKRI
jgi:hypothetical protein